ncbi:siderophore-interacting protein [Microbacterium karelineae]|uniref:siderophore-interacting protein n=1 Tax=Microbacterium karelineae TaxID=2654283 RepID=UPI0012EAA9BE|nr:siderophore-interacting protein [Microbacterium karelineae]
MARRRFTTHPLVLRRAEVRRIRDITPRMRRITLTGAQLGSFEKDGTTHPPFVSSAFDDHIKLIFAEGDIAPALPVQLPHGIEWTASETRRARDYTPRNVTADGFDLDFVIHDGGVASRWAQEARPGDDLWFVGPKASTQAPEHIDWILLVADETGLPAVGRFLDERPIDAPATIVLTISDPTARQELAVRADDRVEWILADPTDGDALVAAVRALGLAERPDVATGYAWCGAESRALLPLRRHLSREVGLPRERLDITGYWHHEDEHEAPEDPAAAGDDAHPVPVPSPRAWFVVRAALQVGLVDAVAASPGIALADAATAVGIDAGPLAPLLGDLLTHGILAGDADGLRLGPAGEELLADEHAREVYDGLDSEILASLDGLGDALRSGTSAWSRRTGASFAAQADGDAELQEELQEGGEQLAYLTDGLLAHAVWESASRVLVVGPGSTPVGLALRGHRAVADVSIAEPRAGLAAIREDVAGAIPTHPLDAVSAASHEADVIVLAHALGHRTDAEATELVARVTGIAPRLLVLEASRPDALAGASAHTEVRHLALTGSALRDADAISALAGAHGWRRDEVVPLGWGVEGVLFTAR